MAQRNWSNLYGSNLYGVLSRAELNACLAQCFNDYESFQPQNFMVHYVCHSPNSLPTKNQQYQASIAEWSALANYCHGIEPTNLTQKSRLGFRQPGMTAGNTSIRHSNNIICQGNMMQRGMSGAHLGSSLGGLEQLLRKKNRSNFCHLIP
jgi:hypothetical protein